MAYSSWTSDLKTRLSVGFLGKVVNLLVQAKDRIDLLHSELALRTTFYVDSEFLNAAALADITDTASNLISATKPLTAITMEGVGGTTSYTLPDGAGQGVTKQISNWFNPGQDLKIYGKIRYPGLSHGAAKKTFMVMNGSADHVSLIWSATYDAWLVADGHASIASYG